LFVKSFLTGQNSFVFYEGIVAAGITLNDEKFGMLYGNHIYIVSPQLWLRHSSIAKCGSKLKT